MKGNRKRTSSGKRQPRRSHPHIDGGILKAAESRYKYAAEKVVTQQGQRMLWVWAVAVADVFGAGPERMGRVMEKIRETESEVAQLIVENGETYAFERLRQRAEDVTGIPIGYWCDDPEGDLRREERRRG